MIAIVLWLLAFTAQAAPWVVYGQTRIVDAIDNPTPNHAGLVGEVTALPYQVPAGKTLRLDGMAIEAHHYQGASPVYVLFPWLTEERVNGTPEVRARTALLSCAASDHTNHCPVRYYIPSGKWLNVRLLAAPSAMSGLRMGWHLYGELL